jgi:hypothetical protein
VHTGVWWGKPEGKNHLQDPGVEGKTILRWIFRNWEEGMDWIDLAQDRDSSFKRSNEPSRSIKCGKFLD